MPAFLRRQVRTVFKFIYPRIWPIVCLTMGLVAALGTHIHFNFMGLSITSHNLMWFAMALAHADVYWKRPAERC